MSQRTETARRPRPYLELGQQALDLPIPCRPDPTHPFWCEVNQEVMRRRGDVSLDGLNQQQEFLIRALVHGMELGMIRTADVRAIPRGDTGEAESSTAWLVYQSGALAAYEAWLARQWSEQDRRFAWDTP
jgi:hypothetical protein